MMNIKHTIRAAVFITAILINPLTAFAEESAQAPVEESEESSSSTASAVASNPEAIESSQQGGGTSYAASIDLDNKPTYLSASKVDVDIHSGSASLSVPIAVPQGRAGIQPSLALAYNSSLKHGISGHGWTMELGSIQRSTKDGPPKYDFNAANLTGDDTFILMQNGSSQELVHVGGGIFRPKLEGAFMEIKYIDATPDYWQVTDKKGIQYKFGGGSGDTYEYNPAPGFQDHIFKWPLTRVEDIHGNLMSINYWKNGNKAYPKEIHYTGKVGAGAMLSFAKVNLEYEDRSDSRANYTPGFNIATGQRLDYIEIFVEDDLQRSYDFQYTMQGATHAQVSMLTSVTMTDSTGTQILPATTFEYDEIAYPQNYSFAQQANMWMLPWLHGQPTEGGFTEFSNDALPNGVEMVDVNADGFADVLWNDDGAWNHSAYLNNQDDGYTQDGSWQPPFPLTKSDNTDSGVRFMDVNGDGLLDVVRRNAQDTTKTYLNDFKNGGHWLDAGTQWNIPGLGASGFLENDNNNDNGVRIADVNGDGLSDVLWADGGLDGERWTYLNDGNGNFVNQGSFRVPVINGGGFTKPDGQSDNGVRIADLNGDGLPDLLYADGPSSPGQNNRAAYINTGKDFVYSDNWKVPNDVFFTQYDRLRLLDVNSDGLADLVFADGCTWGGCQRTWINTGSTFQQVSQWVMPAFQNGGFIEPESGTDNGVRFADVNGDGYVDVVWADGGSSQQRKTFINLITSSENYPQLLTRVDNGTGGVTEIDYEFSNRYENTFLPFAVPVVKSITARDTFSGDAFTTRYEYEGGLWEAYPKREFRGFHMVKTIDADNNYSLTFFHQDDLQRGRIERQESYDAAGNLFAKTVNTYAVENISTDVDFVYQSRVDNFIYDGDSSGRRTASEFIYGESPQYGNLTKTVQLGEIDLLTGTDILGDERTVETEYHNVASPERLIGIPKHTTVKDENLIKVRESFFYYDGATQWTSAPTLGLLTMKEDWAGDAPGTVNPKTQYEYDIYGNLTKTIDPLNNQTQITYDPDYHLFPLVTTNAIGHQAANEYYGINGVPLDDGAGLRGLWGQLKSSMDPNNQTVKTSYDTFGRPVITIAPLDSVAFPTSETEYGLQSDHVKVISHARLEHGTDKRLTSVSFYDGLGRLIQSKSKSETPGVYIVSGQTTYNSRGLPEYKYIPQFTNNGFDTIDPINPTGPKTFIEYDAMGRVNKTANADGSWANVVYDDWTTTSFDENGHKQESTVDAYGRLVEKREYLGADGRSTHYPAENYTLYATTRYDYDSEGNLTTVVDEHNNTTTINYDNLGRKESMDDPDMGVWSYEYDLNGNLKDQVDAKGERIEFDYDALNRLTAKRFATSGAATVNYIYDDPMVSNSKGRLTRANYQTTNDTEFEYDVMGREVRSVKDIDSSQYSVERGYDALSRLVSVKYPDTDEVVYSYNSAGQVEVVGNAQADIPDWDEISIEAPYAHFKMNDNAATPTIVNTGVGGHNAASWTNTSNMTSPGAAANTVSSLRFDGVITHNASCNNLVSSIQNDTQGTIAMWIKPENNTAEWGIMGAFSIWADAFTGLEISHHRGPKSISFHIRFQNNYLYYLDTSPNSFPLDTWTHLVLVQDGTQIKAYVNGELDNATISQVSQPGAWLAGMGGLAPNCRIGGIPTFYLKGNLDDWRYYKSALTAQEVAAIYNSGAGIEDEAISATTGGTVTYPSTVYIKNVDYNNLGQMTKVEFGSGAATYYQYDSQNFRLKHLKTFAPGTSPNEDATGWAQAAGDLQDLAYTYDSVGNILSINDNVNTADQSFTYDALNRLESATGYYDSTTQQTQKTYQYDEIGNIILKDTKTYYYNECNGGPHAVCRLSDGTLFDYDANGNMTSKTDADGTIWVYQFDAENRLTKVKKNAKVVADYSYDGDGGRTKKTVYKPRCVASGSGGMGQCLAIPVGGQPPSDVVNFVGSLFEEADPATGATTNTKYVFLGDQRFASISNGNVLYFHGDHLGSTNVVTDATGVAKEIIEYEPYGQESRHDKLGTPEEVANYYFTAQYKDDESGLYFYNARYYDPLIGRFISADTIVQDPSSGQTFNRYSYVGNNPVNNIDPSGHSFWKKLWGAITDTFKFIHNPVQFNPLLNGIVTGNWAYARDMAIAGVTGFVLGGGPIGAVTAMATTAAMRTPIGEFATENVAHSVFDDALGFSPRTANILSGIAVSTGISLGFERTFANMSGDPIQVKDGTQLSDEDFGKLKEGYYAGDENMFGPSLKTSGAFERNNVKGLMQDGKLVGSFQKRALDVPGLKQLGAQHSSANVLTVSASGSKLNPWKYGTLGVCHQSTNMTLLNGGISSTIFNISPSWDMFVTTAVYGNYGGQLGSRILSGVNANQNYYKEGQM